MKIIFYIQRSGRVVLQKLLKAFISVVEAYQEDTRAQTQTNGV